LEFPGRLGLLVQNIGFDQVITHGGDVRVARRDVGASLSEHRTDSMTVTSGLS
jgi:hypothetical protein